MFGVLLFLFVFALGKQVSFLNCLPKGDDPKYVVDTIEISPDEPQAGQMLTVTFEGRVIETSTGGNVEVNVILGGIKMFSYDYDFCQILQCGCPTTKGKQIGIIKQQIPKLILPGTYNLTTIVTDSDKSEITCVDFLQKLYT